MIRELRAWGVIAKGLLRGKSLDQIVEDEQEKLMAAMHENRRLEAELQELRRAGR